MPRVLTDFNVLVSSEDRIKPKNLYSKLQAALKLGYQLIALNTVIEEDPTTKTKGKKNPKQILIPEPIKIDNQQIGDRKCKILNRITLIMSDPSQGHKLLIKTVKKYDIIAVEPTNEKMFQSICSSWDIDIISFDLTEQINFTIKRPQVKVAFKHEISFEILYAPLIKDRSLRRNVLSSGQLLVDKCRGKNILLSSGAAHAIDFRGPSDVANLGLLFGMNEEDAKNSMCSVGRSVLLHAKARCLGRAVMSFKPITELEISDKWKVERLSEDNQNISEKLLDKSCISLQS